MVVDFTDSWGLVIDKVLLFSGLTMISLSSSLLFSLDDIKSGHTYHQAIHVINEYMHDHHTSSVWLHIHITEHCIPATDIGLHLLLSRFG